MDTIDTYIDAARKRHNIHSDRQLSARLGLSNVAVNYWRQRKAWPSDDTMVALAAMAGVDVSEALADLNCWRAKSPRVRSAYQDLATRLKAVAVALALAIFGTVSGPADAEQNVHNAPSELSDLYIMRLIRQIIAAFARTTRHQF